MLDAIKSFFQSSMAPVGTEEDAGADAERIQRAACALLLELAHADQEFTAEERLHLESAVRRQFGLDDEATKRLVELADEERRQAVDLWQFTSLVARNYSQGQKAVLAEIMWGLVYADGDLAHRESYLMRKIAHLLGLEPGYLAQARKRAEGQGEEPGGAGSDPGAFPALD